MKYFVNEEERKSSHSTCYFEFQKGYYHDKCWLEDSISIHDELWNKFNLSELISGVIENFDYYGTTVVTKSQWNTIVKNSKEADPVWEDIIAEVIPWADHCFEEYEAFTILGM